MKLETSLLFVPAILVALFLIGLGKQCFVYLARWFEYGNRDHVIDESTFYPFRLDRKGVLAFLEEAIYTMPLVLSAPLAPFFPAITRKFRVDADDPLVILVPGYAVKSFCFLRMWWRLRFVHGLRNVVAINNRPQWGRIEDMADHLQEIVEALAPDPQRPVVLVGHSMGGIVIRSYLLRHRPQQRIAGFVTLATPHKGSMLAALGYGLCARQLTPGSRFLAELEGRKEDLREHRYRKFFSVFDAMVVPRESAYLFSPEEVIHFDYAGHLSMLYRPDIIAYLAKEVRVITQEWQDQPGKAGD